MIYFLMTSIKYFQGNSRPNEIGDSEQQDNTERNETNEDDEYAGGLC